MAPNKRAPEPEPLQDQENSSGGIGPTGQPAEPRSPGRPLGTQMVETRKGPPNLTAPRGEPPAGLPDIQPLPSERLATPLGWLAAAAEQARKHAESAPLPQEDTQLFRDCLREIRDNVEFMSHEMAGEENYPELAQAVDFLCNAVGTAVPDDLRHGLATVVLEAVRILRRPSFGPKDLDAIRNILYPGK